MADVHADLEALRARVDELARENHELRSFLLNRGAPGSALPQAGSWTSEVDPRVGLSQGELRRRRWKGRAIAFVLLGLGIGVGLSAASAISGDMARESRARVPESELRRMHAEAERARADAERAIAAYSDGFTIVRTAPAKPKSKATVDTIFIPRPTEVRVAPPPAPSHAPHPARP